MYSRSDASNTPREIVSHASIIILYKITKKVSWPEVADSCIIDCKWSDAHREHIKYVRHFYKRVPRFKSILPPKFFFVFFARYVVSFNDYMFDVISDEFSFNLPHKRHKQWYPSRWEEAIIDQVHFYTYHIISAWNRLPVNHRRVIVWWNYNQARDTALYLAVALVIAVFFSP